MSLLNNHPTQPAGSKIDLRKRQRVRVNIFIHTRNARSHLEFVALRGGHDSKVAYKQWVSEGKEVIQTPDDFPVENPDDSATLFREDEPTGKVYRRGSDGQLVGSPVGERRGAEEP